MSFLEFQDLYSRDGELLLEKHPSNEPRPAGMYLLVINVLIQHEDGRILITQRSPEKEIFPEKWEASIGGRAQHGEDSQTAAQRELFEETDLMLNNLQLINTHIDDQYRIIISNYYGKTAIPHDAIIIQSEEIVNYRWCSVAEFFKLLEENIIIDYSYRDFTTYPLK